MVALRRQQNLTEGPILSTLIAFALPTLGATALQSLNSSINAIWVGHILGDEALAATARRPHPLSNGRRENRRWLTGRQRRASTSRSSAQGSPA